MFVKKQSIRSLLSLLYKNNNCNLAQNDFNATLIALSDFYSVFDVILFNISHVSKFVSTKFSEYIKIKTFIVSTRG